MQAQRIKTGFHRIGVAGASIFGLVAAALLGVVLVHFITKGPLPGNHPVAFVAIGVTFLLIAGGAFYAVMRALGWIVAGFVGDVKNSS